MFWIFLAHCIQQKYWDKKLETKDLAVHLGRYNLSKKDESGTDIIEVSEIVIHPDWKPFETNYDADLAILKLNHEITKSNFIKVACWPTYDEGEIGEGSVVSWSKF